MKTIPIKQLTSWSFSRYSDYKQCPLKAKLKHLDKISEPPNEAMARGVAIHTLTEKYIKGEGRSLPPELKLFKDEFKKLRAQYKKKADEMVVEDNWSFTKDWGKATWDDWVGCWVRIKLDCAHHEDENTLVVTDWKTGKFRPELNEEYVEQLELYALSALLLHEHIEQVKPRLVYLDVGVIYPGPGEELVFTRKDIPKLKKLWEKRTKAMMNDKQFAPRPNDKCRWCFYRNSNKAAGGGQCKY
jgi:putative RecB family exonuclease